MLETLTAVAAVLEVDGVEVLFPDLNSFSVDVALVSAFHWVDERFPAEPQSAGQPRIR